MRIGEQGSKCVPSWFPEETPLLNSAGRPCSRYHVRTLNTSGYCQSRPSISKSIQLACLPIDTSSQNARARQSTRQIDSSMIFCPHNDPKRGSLHECMVTLVSWVQLIAASSPLEVVWDG